MTVRQREQLLASIPLARKHIIEVYGTVRSNPSVYACAERNCYESFNGYGNGRAIGESGILLLATNHAPEVVSHEWSHVELYARVGHDGYRNIPMWFHEGLAVTVSKLVRHSDRTLIQAQARGIAIPKDVRKYGELKEWSDALKRFQNHDRLNVMYAAAGHEVRGWLKRVKVKGLLKLLEAVTAGKLFVTTYDQIVRTATTDDDKAADLGME